MLLTLTKYSGIISVLILIVRVYCYRFGENEKSGFNGTGILPIQAVLPMTIKPEDDPAKKKIKKMANYFLYAFFISMVTTFILALLSR